MKPLPSLYDLANEPPDEHTLWLIAGEFYDAALEESGLDMRVHRRWYRLSPADQQDVMADVRKMLSTPAFRLWMYRGATALLARGMEIQSHPMLIVTAEQAERLKTSTRSIE